MTSNSSLAIILLLLVASVLLNVELILVILQNAAETCACDAGLEAPLDEEAASQ